VLPCYVSAVRVLACCEVQVILMPTGLAAFAASGIRWMHPAEQVIVNEWFRKGSQRIIAMLQWHLAHFNQLHM
jgi:hypothetical protein